MYRCKIFILIECGGKMCCLNDQRTYEKRGVMGCGSLAPEWEKSARRENHNLHEGESQLSHRGENLSQLYVCMYMYVYAYIQTYIYLIHIYIHTYIFLYIHTYFYIYIHIYIYTYVRIYIHAYVHTCIHIFLWRCLRHELKNKVQQVFFRKKMKCLINVLIYLCI